MMMLDTSLTPEEQAMLESNEADEASAAASLPADPAAEPAAEPAAQPPAGEQPPQADDVPQVPIHALHEARMELRELKAAMAERDAQLAQLRALKEQIDEMRAARSQPAEPAPPDRDTDPIGYAEWQIDQQRKQVEALQQRDQQREQMEQAQRQQQELAQTVIRYEQEFLQQQADYPAAVQHVQNLRVAELRALGVTDPREIQQALYNAALQVSIHALQRRQNPAQVMYEIAKSYGYKPAAGAPAAQPAPGNASQPGLAQGVPAGVPAQQQAASRSLSRAAGEAPAGELSAEQLLELDGDAYLAAWDKLFGKNPR